MPTMLAVAIALLGAADPGAAMVRAERAPAPPRTYVELRMGPTTASRNARPAFCFEGRPVALLSLEACGTGAGLLHQDPEPEMTHLRLAVHFGGFEGFGGYFVTALSGGIAALSIEGGAPGFAFDVDPRGVQTAGPEIGLSLRFVFALTERFELVGKASSALAYLPHADELRRPMGVVQPTVSGTLGVGF